MYEVHTYATKDHKYDFGVVAENGNKIASDDQQGYENIEDMNTVLRRLFVPARGDFMGKHVPWEDCGLHASSSGKCYRHKIVDARTLAQSLQGDAGAPSPHDP
jgi:hypothetical protein